MSDQAGTQHTGTGAEPVFVEGTDAPAPAADAPVDAASVYAAQIRGADTSTQVQADGVHETSTGLDFTPPRQTPPNTPDVESQPEVARQGGEAAPETPAAPETAKITVNGREFDSYEQAAAHFAAAHEEATRYISQTSRGERSLDDLGEEYEEEESDQVEVRIGDPRTWEEARALAESESLADREQGFEWALRMRERMGDEFPVALYDEMVNGYAVANMAGFERRMAEVRAAEHQARLQETIGPQLQADAHRATREGLTHFQTVVGEAEAAQWAPYLNQLIAQGAILQDPNRVLDGSLVGQDLVQVYETLKGQQLLGELRAGRMTPEAYQQASLDLAMLGRQAPAPAAPNGNGQVVQQPPIAAGPQHTSHLVGDKGGPVQRANPAQSYVDHYKQSVASAPRSGY